MDYSNHNKEDYLGSRIDALPFANGLEPTNALDIIHNLLIQLGQSHDVALNNTSGSSSNKSATPTIDSVDGSLTLILQNDDVEALKNKLILKSHQ